MKKLILLYSIIAISVMSCKKDDSNPAVPGNNNNNNNNNNNTSTVPSSFTQKVLIEEFTGAGQSQSTDGFVKLNTVTTANATTSIPVAIHFSDGMEIAQYTSLFTNFSNGAAPMFPSAMLNRTASLSTVILNRLQWQSNYDVDKDKTAAEGLAIKSSVSGSTATVEVHCGFSQALTGSYTLSVYLCENNVMGSGTLYDQRNAYNTTSGHPYAGAGDPILNFNHKYVLRNVGSLAMGDLIPAANVITGGEFIKTYNFNITSYKLADLYVVAFISKVGTSAIDQPVMNVQKVNVGSTQNWD